MLSNLQAEALFKLITSDDKKLDAILTEFQSTFTKTIQFNAACTLRYMLSIDVCIYSATLTQAKTYQPLPNQ